MNAASKPITTRTRADPATGRDLLHLEDDVLIRLCEQDTYRASGPGGQKRNKTDSAVRLRLPDWDVMVIAEESRSQHDNRRRALRRIRFALALHVRRQVSRESYVRSKPMAECINGKGQLSVSKKNHRYTAVVGEIMDVLAACDMRLSDAAATIGVSTGQLSRLITDDTKFRDAVNRLRADAGLHPIR